MVSVGSLGGGLCGLVTAWKLQVLRYIHQREVDGLQQAVDCQYEPCGVALGYPDCNYDQNLYWRGLRWGSEEVVGLCDWQRLSRLGAAGGRVFALSVRIGLGSSVSQGRLEVSEPMSRAGGAVARLEVDLAIYPVAYESPLYVSQLLEITNSFIPLCILCNLYINHK